MCRALYEKLATYAANFQTFPPLQEHGQTERGGVQAISEWRNFLSVLNSITKRGGKAEIV